MGGLCYLWTGQASCFPVYGLCAKLISGWLQPFEIFFPNFLQKKNQ